VISFFGFSSLSVTLKMGDLSDILSRKLNLSSSTKGGGGATTKLQFKKTTPHRRAHETEDDVAVLSLILPGEPFLCHLGDDCKFMNPSHNALGTVYSLSRTIYHYHPYCLFISCFI